jgi:hypothetical protein
MSPESVCKEWTDVRPCHSTRSSGNVDHLVWVTMTDEGPQIGNLALKGIFDRKGLDPSLFGAYDRRGLPLKR